MNGTPSIQISSAGRGDLARTVLAVLFIIALAVSTAWILLPFLVSLVWAGMIVISTWPLLLACQKFLWGRRGLSAAVMTSGLLLMVLVPLALAAGALADNVLTVAAWAKSIRDAPIPPPPQWTATLPVIGPAVSEAWNQAAAEGKEALASRVMPYVGKALEWVVRRLGGLGTILFHFFMTIVLTAVFYLHGETAASGLLRFAQRLAGASGEKAVQLAAGAVRGVAAGVLLTALIQSLAAAIGLAVCSIPAAPLLISAVILLCLAQLGPLPVMVPAVIWKFYSGDTFWAAVLAAFTLLSATIDNILRPALMRRGGDLPLVLIFAGVIGGMISAGIVGLFVGPVVLAVAHALLSEWLDDPAAVQPPGAADENS